jgi:deoxyribonuclease V
MHQWDPRHPWPRSVGDLEALQADLAERARAALPWIPPSDRPVRIAGVFAVFATGHEEPERAWAGAVVMEAGRVLATAGVRARVEVPYMPGHLALQRGPLLEAAVTELEPTPDILLVNATGWDHPRRAGLALHLGAVLDLVTIGVTVHPLVATDHEPGPEEGATAPLSIDGEIVGVVLRTRRHIRPVVVHPGWRTDPETARLMVEQCTGKARSPEPLRVARFLARTRRARDEGRLVGPPQLIDTVLRPR